MSRTRIGLRAGVVSGVLAVCLIAVAPASAGGGTTGEPRFFFLNNGSSNCCTSAKIKPGKTKTFQAVAVNSGDDDVFVLEGFEPSNSDYKVDWYEGLKAKSSKRITSEVTGPGYDFGADSNTATSFTVTVKRKQGDEACVSGQLEGSGQFAAGAIVINDGLCVL